MSRSSSPGSSSSPQPAALALTPSDELATSEQLERWFYCPCCGNYRQGDVLVFRIGLQSQELLHFRLPVKVCAQCGLRHLERYPEVVQRYVKSNGDLPIFGVPKQEGVSGV